MCWRVCWERNGGGLTTHTPLSDAVDSIIGDFFFYCNIIGNTAAGYFDTVDTLVILKISCFWSLCGGIQRAIYINTPLYRTGLTSLMQETTQVRQESDGRLFGDVRINKKWKMILCAQGYDIPGTSSVPCFPLGCGCLEVPEVLGVEKRGRQVCLRATTRYTRVPR